MNSETFAQFLKTPAYLYRISYQELKSLVVQYPYCQNLRFLLLKKSQTDQNPEYERNLQMAATYSINRGFLYEQLYSSVNTPINRESNVATEDELLLKDLDALDLEAPKEVLLAETKEEANLNINPIIPISTALDLPETDILEVFEGDKSSDDLAVDLDSSIEELFEDIEDVEVSDNELNLVELETTNEGHQVSETIETVEDKEEILSDIISSDKINNLDITDEIDEEDIPEVLPEASSDDFDDLFADDLEIDLAPTPSVEDNASLGLDVEPIVKIEEIEEIEEILANTEEREEKTGDFMANIARGIGAVSIASLVADSEKEESEPIIDLELEKIETSPATVDIMDLTPVSQSEPEEAEEFETITETELISPQSSFSNWLKQFNSPQISVEIEDLDEKSEKGEKKKVNYTYELINGEWKQIKTKVKKKKKKSKTQLIAAESVKLSKDVATETLAQLLEKQEHYAKAIKMYERLRLENPEKSDYFATRIEALQLKL